MIKFRAWEKNMNEMIPVENIDFLAKQINTNSAWRMFREIELMQSTRLEDKNGVEIYEGDIVRNEQHIYMVRLGKFTDSDYFQNTTQHQTGFYIVDIHTDETFPFYSMNYETIGNIYENPELLEVAK